MIRIRTVIASAILLITLSCTKDRVQPNPLNECGTTTDISWVKEVKRSDFIGNWTINKVSYSKGHESTSDFDTTFQPERSLVLNNDGTGQIDNQPLLWSFQNAGGLPRLTISELDTLFSFPVDFFINHVADFYVKAPPHSSIWINSRRSINSNWESADFSLTRE